MTRFRTAEGMMWIAALWLAAALHQAAAASPAPVPTSPGGQHLPRGVFAGETEVLEVRVPVWILGPKGVPVRDVRCSDLELLEDGGPVQLTSCEPPRPSEAPAPEAWARPSGSCELTVFVDMYLATPGEVAGAVRDIAERLASLQGRKVNLVAFDGVLHRYDLRAAAAENDEILAEVRKLKAQGAVIVPEEDSGGVLRGRGSVREHGARCDTVRRAVERSADAFAGVAAEAAARCPGAEIWLYSPLVPRSGGPDGSERFMGPRSSCSDEVLVSIWRRVGGLISGAGGWLRVVDPRGVLPEAGWHGSSVRRQAGQTLVRATGGEYVRTGAPARFSRSDAYVLSFAPEHGRDGCVHEIRVRVKNRPGLRLRWRREYVALRSEDLEGLKAVAEALSSKGENPLGIAIRLARPKRREPAEVEVLVPYRRPALVPVGDRLEGDLLLAVFKEGDRGDRSQVASFEGKPSVGASEEADARRRGYFAFRFRAEVGKGKGTLCAVVTDRVSGVRSSARAPLESPREQSVSNASTSRSERAP